MRWLGILIGTVLLAIGSQLSAAPPAAESSATKPSSAGQVIVHPALFLVGDSIMATGSGDGSRGPWGYGTELIGKFDSSKIHVYNEAKGGRSSRGYIEEGAWAKVLEQIQAGDWVLVDFGHNDARNSQNYPDRVSGQGNGDELSDVDAPSGKKQVHSYGWYLRQYAQDVKAKGATLIILSPVPRNQWANGKINRGFDGYAGWAAEAAKTGGTLYIDLNTLVADRFDALGQQATAEVFSDVQHTKKSGAKIGAESVVVGLRQLPNCPLAADLLPDSPATQPSP